MNSLAAQLGVEYRTCPTCGATPGNRCRTVAGRKPGTATLTHEPRSQPFTDAWWQGLQEGRRYGQQQALWRAARALKADATYDGQALIDWLNRTAKDVEQ